LNALPLAPAERERTSVFLTQAGDYAYRAALAAARGEAPAADSGATLQRLEEQAERLTRDLHAVLARANRGELRWQELQRMATARARDRRWPVGDSFSRIEEGMSEYPTLLYDGPFSDHVSRREPRALPDETISPEEARAAAADFLSLALN